MEVVRASDWRPTLPAAEFIKSFKNYHRDPSSCSGIQLLDEGRNFVTIGWNKPTDEGSSAIIIYKIETIDEEGKWKELGLSPRPYMNVYGFQGTRKIRVTPGNSQGWGEPTEATLDIPETNKFFPYFILELPGEINLPPDGNITLKCKAEGNPKPEISWYFNGENLKTSEEKITLENLKESGLYVCEARNRFGKASTHCYITIVPPGSPLPVKHQIRLLPPEGQHGPEIKFPLRDREVDLGEPVRLTLEVVGEPKPTVEWQKDGEPLEGDNYLLFSDGNFHTLELVATQKTEGLYTARASGLGIAVSSAVVTIKPYFSCHFILPLEPYARVKLGGDIRLIATLAPHCRCAKVVWTRDGMPLVPSRNCVMFHSAGGDVTLELGHVTRKAAGIYKCTVNGQGELKAESSCEVEVSESESPSSSAPFTPIPYSQKPIFVTKPRNVEGLEGDTIILRCEVVGEPNPTITWMRDDLKISRYSRDQGEFRERRSGPESSLEIRHAKLSYTGKYTAWASNVHGQASAVCTVQLFARGQGKTVKSKDGGLIEAECDSLPLVTRPLSDNTVTLQEPVYLQCRIKGEPQPNIIWTKDRKLVKRGKNWFEAETATLEIPEPCLADEGTYTCTATNPLGTATTSAYVRVIESPNDATTHPLKTISPCVISAPRFLSVPHSQAVRLGEQVRLSCSISGWPEPETSWSKDGLPASPSFHVFEEEDRRWLVIPAATTEDQGQYTVVCTNSRGSVQASANLHVINEYGVKAIRRTNKKII